MAAVSGDSWEAELRVRRAGCCPGLWGRVSLAQKVNKVNNVSVGSSRPVGIPAAQLKAQLLHVSCSLMKGGLLTPRSGPEPVLLHLGFFFLRTP